MPEIKLRRNIEIALAVVVLIWAVFLADWFLSADLRLYGVRPRRVDGLAGIFFFPFLHADLRHLAGNSGALFVLLAMSLSLNRIWTAEALLIIVVVSGGGVWVFGKPGTVHIGASGVVFGLIGFLVFIGLFQHRWKTLIVSVLVATLYGGVALTLFRYTSGISWSGHFWGFVSGVLSAWWLRKSEP